MTEVVKFNTCKGFSTVLTFLTPLVTLMCTGDFLVKRPSTAISGAAVFAILLTVLLTKDKILEKFKAPSALVIAVVVLAFCLIVENIVLPLKVVSLATIIACGVDEVTFKRIYKGLERKLPIDAAELKKLGFYVARQSTVDTLRKEATHGT